MFESFTTRLRQLYTACMQPKKYFWRLWYIFATITIFFSLMITVARFITPLLHDYQPEILNIAANKIGYPISAQQLEASWLGFHPVIKLVDVDLYNPQNKQKVLHINRIYLSISVFKSVLAQQLLTNQISLSGSHITLFIKNTGAIFLGGPDGLLLHDPTQPTKKFGLEFLFQQKQINLKHLRMQWQQENQKRHEIFVEQFTLANDAKNHRAVGKIHLNRESTPAISFFINFYGLASHIEQWKFNAYLETHQINLKQLASYLPFASSWTLNGQASGRLWINWDKGLRRIQTKINWLDPELSITKTKYTAHFKMLSGTFSWLNSDAEQWIFAGKDVTIQQHERASPQFDFLIKNKIHRNSLNHAEWQIYTNYFDLQNYLPLILQWPTLNPNLKAKLESLAPSGEINYFNLNLHYNDQKTIHYQLNTVFSNLSLQPYLIFPGVKNLTGKISANDTKGQSDLNIENGLIYFPKIFSSPQYLKKSHTHLTWQKEHHTWKISMLPVYFSTPDGDSLLQLVLTLPTDDQPAQMALVGAAYAPAIRHIEQYLPDHIMPQDLVKWLKQAIPSSEDSMANIVWRGPIIHFPYSQHNGRFQILARVKNAKLHYYQNWPELSNLTGTLNFDGPRMEITAESGRIFSSKLSQVIATIDNFLAPQIILHVNGKAQGDAADGLHFLLSSPLATTLGKGLNDLALNGEMKLILSLSIPFNKTMPIAVHGQTQLINNTLKEKSWNLSFQKINALLDFTRNSLSTTQDGQAEFLQHPLLFNIQTQSNQKGIANILVHFIGTLDISQLQGIIPDTWQDKFSGIAPMQAELAIPLSGSNAHQTLTLFSSLQGIAIHLPAPLSKNTHDKEDLQIRFDINPLHQSIMQIIYGTHISSVLQFNKVAEQFQLFSGEIALGRKNAQVQNQPGILLSGTLANFDWTTWKNFLQNKANSVSSSSARSSSQWQNLINRLDLDIPTFNLNALTLTDLHVIAKKLAQGWQATIASPLAQGSVLIPQNYPNGTVVMNLRRLSIPNNFSSSKNTKTSLRPSDLPALMLKSDNTHFGNLDLGHMQLNLQPTKQGLNINRFSAQTSSYDMLLQGNWIGGKTNTTTLKGQVNSSDLKSTLREWNFKSSIDNDDATIDFLVAWHGSPWIPDLPSLRGTMYIKMGHGRINGLERGANLSMALGRLLNLFNLSSLPRRLHFDFSDVTKKGYTFEKMIGTFNLAQGSATTRDAVFKSTIADIAFTGRIGYTTRDYDLRILISPELTSSIPLVATIAGGPVAGIAALAAQKILNPGIKKVIAYHYHITGTWDNPQIKQK